MKDGTIIRGALMVLAALALSACATSQGPATALDPKTRAERPTYLLGEKWMRDDGVYVLVRIEDDRYIFSAGPGQEIHLTKNLMVARVQRGQSHWDFDPPPALTWPLEVGKWGTTWVLVRTSSHPEGLRAELTWSVDGYQDIHVLSAGTFKAFRISLSVIPDRRYLLFPGVAQLWYAPDARHFVKMEGTGMTSFLNFELVAAGPPVTVPPPVTPPSAAPPNWERGDEWGFRWSSPRGSGTFFRSVVGEDVIEGVPYYVLRSGNREIIYSKGELAWLMERVGGKAEQRASPPYRRFAWPLQVGKEWETRYVLENPRDRTTEDRFRRLKVEALGTITVPAGRFQAFHVVVKDRTGGLTDEYWYSSEVKGTVKERSYFSYGVHERELIEYTLKSATTARAPTADPEDEAAVKAIVETWKVVLRKDDMDGFLALFAPDARIDSIVARAKVDKEKYEAVMREAQARGGLASNYEARIRSLAFPGPDLAVLELYISWDIAGGRDTYRHRWTLKKREGRWLILETEYLR